MVAQAAISGSQDTVLVGDCLGDGGDGGREAAPPPNAGIALQRPGKSASPCLPIPACPLPPSREDLHARFLGALHAHRPEVLAELDAAAAARREQAARDARLGALFRGAAAEAAASKQASADAGQGQGGQPAQERQGCGPNGQAPAGAQQTAVATGPAPGFAFGFQL